MRRSSSVELGSLEDPASFGKILILSLLCLQLETLDVHMEQFNASAFDDVCASIQDSLVLFIACYRKNLQTLF